jgi:hypothetical protein
MTTPVTIWSHSLARLWKIHGETEESITRYSLRQILELVQGATRDEIMSLELTYDDSAMWAIVVNRDDEGVHTLDAYDLDPKLADQLWEVTPSFWQWMSHLLVPYTETAYVEIEKAFGMTEGAIFTPRYILSPRTPEEVVKVQTEREEKARAEADAQLLRKNDTN